MKFKIVTFALTFAFFSFSTIAFATEPKVDNYKLNGKEESVKLNPSRGDVVDIEINTDVLVKFNGIDICRVDDLVCDTKKRVRHYYTTTEVSSVTRPFDGKTSGTDKAEVVPDGDYKIKVTMFGVEKPQELSPHIITIDSNYFGGSGGSSSISSESSSSQSSSVSSDISSLGSPSFISTHSSPEELSLSSKSLSRFEVISGRDRLAYSGTPVIFSGEAIIPKSLEGQSVKFIWSFGDGSSAEGRKISHTYKFAGDYIVALNTSLSDLSAVSRTSVKVVNPSVAISNISVDSVEIWNKGIFEINLNGWFISNDRGKFIFPQDTIVGPNKKITVPDEYMKLSLAQGGKVFFLNPSQKEISSFVYGGEGSSSSSTFAINFSDLDNDPVVKKIREFIATEGKSSVGDKTIPISKSSSSRQVDGAQVISSKKSITENKEITVSENNKIISSSTQVVATVSSQVHSRGFIRNLFSLPSHGFSFIKKTFYLDN
mgnify:CR=1 FL=1